MYKATAFIGGNFISYDKEIQINSPIDGSLVGTIPVLNEEQVMSAFESAEEAFHKWKKVDYKTRVKYLLEYASKIRENAVVLSQILHKEVGKNLKDANDEIMRTVDYIVETSHAFADMMEKPEQYDNANNILVPVDINAIYLRYPRGVALTISPFNYPVNLLITKVVPAIITGNTVVHKSATMGSICGWYLAKLFNEIAVDGYLVTPGVFNYVTGKGSELGEWLVKYDKIKAFSFTGSTDIGLSISKKLPPMPLQLELGGHNPVVVMEDADLNLVIDEIAKGAFAFSGQRCTSVKRAFVHKNVFKAFKEKLTEKLKTIKLTEPLIDSRSVARFKEAYEDAISKGAEIIGDAPTIEGNFVTPAVFTGVTREMIIFNEEIFAPVLNVDSFSKKEEIEDLCNDSKYGLQASIFSNNVDEASKIALKLDFGRININAIPSRSPDILPFCGTKESGLENQGIKNSLFFFTRFQGIVLKKR